jgi:hypothetical protein
MQPLVRRDRCGWHSGSGVLRGGCDRLCQLRPDELEPRNEAADRSVARQFEWQEGPEEVDKDLGQSDRGEDSAEFDVGR